MCTANLIVADVSKRADLASEAARTKFYCWLLSSISWVAGWTKTDSIRNNERKEDYV